MKRKLILALILFLLAAGIFMWFLWKAAQRNVLPPAKPVSAEEMKDRQQFDQARFDYEAGEFDSGMKKLLPLADKGYGPAVAYLGGVYLTGTGVEKDIARGIDLYTKAGNGNYPAAQTDLGDMYYDGLGVQKDFSSAYRWYLKAAGQGEMDALWNIAYMVNSGEVSKDAAPEALGVIKAQAEQGNSWASMLMGALYERGQLGLPCSGVLAVEWYKKAAALGNMEAQWRLGVVYHYGKGVQMDYPEALKWYKAAASQGHKEARVRVCFLTLYGRQIKRNWSEALDWCLVPRNAPENMGVPRRGGPPNQRENRYGTYRSARKK